MRKVVTKGRLARVSAIFGVFIVLGVLAGFAAGQALTDDPNTPDGAYATAAECPDAASIYEEAGIDADYFVPDCPTEKDLSEDQALVMTDPEILNTCVSAQERGNRVTDTCQAILKVAVSRGEL